MSETVGTAGAGAIACGRAVVAGQHGPVTMLGPLALLDLVALDVSAAIGRTIGADAPPQSTG